MTNLNKIAVEDAGVKELERLLEENNIDAVAFGKLEKQTDVLIRVM